ncbi:hypothetical protein [Blautia sp. An249]|nr:hypothetical protein [Blautia sp. An249]
MGNSTGSMMYMFGAVILLYFIGVGIYQLCVFIRNKWRNRK